MQDDILSSAFCVRDPKRAAALADPLRRRILLYFVSRQCGVAELAKATGMEIKRLHYHVNALARLGLVKIASRRRRGGRAIKIYRAVAPAFFVPAEHQHQSSSLVLFRQMEETMQAARARRDEGMLYYVETMDDPRMRRVSRSPSVRLDTPAEFWRLLSLSNGDARNLSADMADLFKKYANSSGGTWLVHFALCPTKQPLVKHAVKDAMLAARKKR